MRRYDHFKDLALKALEENCDYYTAKRVRKQHRFFMEWVRQLKQTEEYKHGS